MTEQEWLQCVDPAPMLNSLDESNPRKLRLFAVACCRRIQHLLTDPLYCELIDLAERCAEGEVTVNDVLARKNAIPRTGWSTEAMKAALEVGGHGAWFSARRARSFAVDAIRRAGNPALADKERMAQSNLLRDIFGNPFRPVFLEPQWLTPTVRTLAALIDENQAYQDMPILGDALEDAGCTAEAILDHCHGSVSHVRGCWALDLLLGK